MDEEAAPALLGRKAHGVSPMFQDPGAGGAHRHKGSLARAPGRAGPRRPRAEWNMSGSIPWHVWSRWRTGRKVAGPTSKVRVALDARSPKVPP